jgi:zinc protease
MKKSFMKALLAFAAILTFVPAVNAAEATVGSLPLDENVRIGHLPNGLTYYIRHNEKPKGQADFYIAQKVGSILEEDNQRGLAHFLEHMCFNGTKSFPGNDMISWFESIGVKFGYNLNAYTSIDQTVYNISNVPVDRVSVQDSCLLVLHDWANALLLEDEEIDKERGVIHEEWRRSNVGSQRIIENLLPTIYPNSRYGYRLPIGTMEIVDNFPHQALRDYYTKWYRPDQQGIIVVGDIDVDRIEAKIKEMFSHIAMPENPATREYFPVEDTPGTIYAIGSDKEMPQYVAEMMFKTDAFPDELKNSPEYLVQKYVIRMFTKMLDNRLDDISSTPDAPFAQAGVSYGNFFLAKTKDALSLSVAGKDADLVSAFKAAYRELLRAARGGFTATEYDRARSEYLSALDKEYEGRNAVQTSNYVNRYVNHFLSNEPIPSIEVRKEIMSTYAQMIPVELINQMLPQIIQNDNRVLLALLPDKEGEALPTEAQFADAISQVEAEDIEAFVDEVKTDPLIPNLPKAGKIKKETYNAQWDATEMTLSNGLKVIVKPTKFKDDQILFEAIAKGGTSKYSDDLATDLRVLDVYLSRFGLGTYTQSDLTKYLAGKQVGIEPSINDYEREISGQSTPKDLATLMELIYATFTESTITPDEFTATQNMYAGLLKNQESNPQYRFSKALSKAIYANDRRQAMTAQDILDANRDNLIKIVNEMTANAADYEFVFVGNIDLETIRPLIKQYIATLPANTKKVYNDRTDIASLNVKDGQLDINEQTEMQTPQTWTFIGVSGTTPYSAKNADLASIAGQILSKRLLTTVREDMGAVYSISASGRLSRKNGKNTTLVSSFPMKPEMKQEVLDYIKAEIFRMQSDIQPEELSKAVEFMVKNAKEGKELNGSWLNAIAATSLNNVDTFNGDIEVLQAITVDDVQNFMKDLLKQGNYVNFALDPIVTEAPAAE